MRKVSSPKVANRPVAVLLFHGLRCSKDTLVAEARAFEAAGLVPIPVDAPHHGARRSALLDTMPDTSTVEGYRRLLAILREARDEVPTLVDRLLDEGHERVAIAGVSMGAFIALAAATIEPRLVTIVSILGSPDWTPPDQDAAPFAAELRESPHLRPEAFPPRPLLLLNGALDENVRPEGARALASVLRPRYATLGAGAALVHREWDVPHFVPSDVWREMIGAATKFVVDQNAASP
jgi:pimeloyl-ACP methyl ester carboxylesterase